VAWVDGRIFSAEKAPGVTDGTQFADSGRAYRRAPRLRGAVGIPASSALARSSREAAAGIRRLPRYDDGFVNKIKVTDWQPIRLSQRRFRTPRVSTQYTKNGVGLVRII
jgi:hypothetical protein